MALQSRSIWRPTLEALEDRATPATFTVNVATDSVDPADFLTGVGSGSIGDLRYAIAQADTTAGEDTIVFSLPANTTITLGQAMRPITDPAGLFIRGDTATNLTISGGNAVRVFFVTNNAVFGVNDLTIANGLARGGNGSNGGGGGAGLGGGLLIDSGIVSLMNITFSGNQAIGGNGAAAGNFGGGGGGAGGNAGDVKSGTSGGGGFLGAGGRDDPNSFSTTSGGGGGGFTGSGGTGHIDGEAPGENGSGIGGGGGSGTTGGLGVSGGGNGSTASGGGGGSLGFAGSSAGSNGNATQGGNGGFGGGGGAGNFGGDGGAYGGGGGAGQVGGSGGFGGGGGNGNTPGDGGFGGGGGGGSSRGGSGGQFAGNGANGHFGGGGAGLGGAIFQRSGSLMLINTTFNNNTATGGNGGGGTAGNGQGKGGALFIHSGATARSFDTAPSFLGNAAADAGSATGNPQDNANVLGTLVAGGTLAVTGGDNQRTATNTPFAQELQVTLRDSNGDPVTGAVVTFSAPGTGASATFPGGRSFGTDANGTVTAPVTANGTTGTYTVTASFAGLSTNFSLTNGTPPTITSADSTTFMSGSAGSFAVAATGFPAPTFSLGAAPAWLSIDSTTGALTGTPPDLGAGPYLFSITVVASNGVAPEATQTFTLTVNQAPAITSGDTTTFTVGETGNFTVNATGFPAPTFALAAAPAWLSIDAVTGELTGTPPTESGGTYAFTITATNGVAPDGVQAFTLTVHQAPAFTTLSETVFAQGMAGSFTIATTGFPVAAITSSGALPDGVTLTDNGDGTATLAGTPAPGTGGLYTLTLTAANGVAPVATQLLTLTVNQAPAFTSGNSATFTVGQAASFAITATGFPAPTFAVSAGTLPDGISLSPAGILSGTPEAGTAGTVAVTITATNGVGTGVIQEFALTINEAPVFTSEGSIGFIAGETGSFTVSAAGSPPPVLSLVAGELPPGLTFDASTGAITGIPGTTGTFPLTVQATNVVGTLEQQIRLTVVPVVLTATGSPVGAEPRVVVRNAGGAVRFNFMAFDANFRGGVRVATADLNGDGVDDIVAGAGAGGSPHVKVFDGRTGDPIASFFAYDSSFRGGVAVGAADMDGDGTPDIVAGAGPGGAPHVRAFRFDGLAEVASFFAFESTFRGGVNVASGDLTEDSIPDLVLGAGAEGGPVVLVFDGDTGIRVAQFFAGPEQDRGGVQVAVRDLDGSGANELVTRVADVTRVFDPLTGEDVTARYTTDQLGGVFVG